MSQDSERVNTGRPAGPQFREWSSSGSQTVYLSTLLLSKTRVDLCNWSTERGVSLTNGIALLHELGSAQSALLTHFVVRLYTSSFRALEEAGEGACVLCL